MALVCRTLAVCVTGTLSIMSGFPRAGSHAPYITPNMASYAHTTHPPSG